MKTAAIIIGILTSWLNAQNLVVTTQHWEIPHDTLDLWVKLMQQEPDAVAGKLGEASKKNQAKFHGLHVIQGSAEATLHLEQIRELIFPSDYEPPEIPPTPPIANTSDSVKTDPVLEKLLLQGYQKATIPPSGVSVPTTFQPRNVGMTISFDSKIHADDHVSLLMAYEHVRLAEITDYHSNGSQTKPFAHQVPQFAVERTSRKLKLKSGQWMPFAIWQRTESKQCLIVLVRVDVM